MRKTIVGAILATAAATAQGQLIVGNDQAGTATIWYVDVESGVATPIYSSSSTTAKPWGMAYDPSSNTLFWNNGGSLYSSPMSMNLAPTLVASMTFNGAATNFVGLAWRDGKLWGTRNISTEAVYSIDPVTGVATQEYVYSSLYDFGGLDVDLTTGRMYGLSDTAPAGAVRGLYEINVEAASTSFVAGYPGSETDLDGLAVHAGVAYFVSDGPNTVQANFYMVDVESGSLIGTIPSPFTGSGTFSAAAFVPSPGALGMLAVAGLAPRRRR